MQKEHEPERPQNMNESKTRTYLVSRLNPFMLRLLLSTHGANLNFEELARKALIKGEGISFLNFLAHRLLLQDILPL